MHEVYKSILNHYLIVIVEKFESELRNANPKLININYGLNDIFNYIDDYKEFNILW